MPPYIFVLFADYVVCTVVQTWYQALSDQDQGDSVGVVIVQLEANDLNFRPSSAT